MAWVPLADGQSLFVRVIGRGKPVLMLPGLGMNSRQWLPFVLPFSHRFRFYMPDFRGHGRSRLVTLANQGDVFQSHADDVKQVIEYFGLDDYLLAGISLGATTAMHLERDGALAGARRYLHIDQSPCVLNQPDWTHGLCGVSQPALHERMAQLEQFLNLYPEADYVDQLPADSRQQLVTLFDAMSETLGVGGGARWALQNLLPVAPAWLLRRLPLMRLSDMRAYLNGYLRAGHDYRPTLGSAGLPVTLMPGANSALYALAGQQCVADAAPESEVVVFERSGHVPLVDEPLKFLREFGRFLKA